MASTRREFLKGAAGLSAGGVAFLSASGEARQEEPVADDDEASFRVVPVGRVEKTEEATVIRIFERYRDALQGLADWSHVNVLYWFDRNDVPPRRAILRVHPRGDRDNPLTGVFACRAPVRPNLIALSVCRVLSVEDGVVTVDEIDAFDGTPVLDLKPYTPRDAAGGDVRVPDWARDPSGGPPGDGGGVPRER